MSLSHVVLARSERLLPLESTAVLDSTGSFSVHVLSPDAADDAFTADVADRSSASEQRRRLHEHVSIYWDHQHNYRDYQRRLLREVGSTRGAVRFVGFPQVRPPAATASSAGAAPPPPVTDSSASAAAASPGGSSAQQGSTGTSTAAPPRSLAAWNWVSLVAPYERLLSPSLLFSALLSPGVAAHTGLRYGTQPPLPSAHSTSAAPSSPCVPAHWGLQTCETLWGLHAVAAEASLPAQEVYVMCAGTLLYLDVVIAAGRVWAELEGLWGSRELGQQCAAELESELVGSAKAIPDASAETGEGAAAAAAAATTSAASPTSTPPNAAAPSLRQLRAFLSQPAPTYSAMLQHVRVLLEALTAPPPVPSKSAPLVPDPLAPWIASAMTKEEWTTASPASSAAAGSRASTDSAPHTLSASAPVKLLRHAVTTWLARRGATVSAIAPTGCRAVALPARDLYATRGPESGEAGALESPPSPHTAASSPPPPPPLQRSRSLASAGSRRSAAAATGNDFEAFAPHDAPRAQHPFALPPLPQDPALVALAVVWRRTLRRCVTEPDVLRLRLRQVILGCTGERCEELMREAAELAKLQEQREQAEPHIDAPASPAFSEQAGSAAGSSSAGSAVQAPAVPLLLASDPAATSFCVLGPRFGEWLASSRGGGGWCGFRGQLFRCVGPPPSRPPAAAGGGGPRRRPAAAAAARRSALASTHASSPASRTVDAAEPLTEPFVDGALAADSTRAGVAGFALVPFSPEELADRLCRLGASLPRYATEVNGDRLRPADVDFAKEVLQRYCLPLYLACQKRGEQQWGLRSWMKGIVLTLMDKSGAESRVTSPAKLIAMAQQQQQSSAAAGGGGGGHDAMTLRMVMDGGWSEAVALLEHVQKRSEATLRWLSVRRIAGDTSGSAYRHPHRPPATPATATATAMAGFSGGGAFSSTSVRVLLLRRAEESALFRIFQSHPAALLLSGCGAQRLALLPTAHAGARLGADGVGGGVGGGGGAAAAGNGTAGLSRSPTSLSCTLLLIRVCGVAVEWDLQECYERPRLRRLREPRRLASHHPPVDAVSGKSALWPPLPAELASAVDRVSLRHVRGMLQYYLRSLTSSTASTATDGDDPSTHTRKRERTGDLEDSPGSEAPAGASSSAPRSSSDVQASPSQTDAEEAALSRAPRTALYPIDRAALLYVVRHHPQYYPQVLGCGIKEVYVAAVPAMAITEAVQPPMASTDAASTPLSEVNSEQASPVPPPSAAAAAAAASTGVPASRAAVVVERFCGQWVEVDVEACYDKGREGRPLRPCLILA